MKLGVLGGTFNPIHNSHLYLVRVFLQSLGLDRLLLVPACRPPHKEAPRLEEGVHRLAMCRIAAAGFAKVEVSSFEIDRGGRSYTVDTLEHLRREYPGAQLYLLMGGDMFLTVREWRRAGRLMELAVLCAAAREPGERKALEAHRRVLEAEGARCLVLDIPAKPMSSTRIRRLLAGGEDASGLLPPGVYAYIQTHKLYREE